MNTRTLSLLLVLGVGLMSLLFGGWRGDYYYEKDAYKAFRNIAEVKRDQKLPNHTEVFKFTSLHGAEFIREKALCMECHGQDLKGGIFKSSCLKCHPVLNTFPHFSKDIMSSHGAAYLKEPVSCKGCHGGELQGSGGAVACSQCHNYPHSARWSVPTAHGPAFLKEFHKEEVPMGPGCLDCHKKGSDFEDKYGSKFVSCASCHLEIPHEGGTKEWAELGGHPEPARKYDGKCLACHQEYKANMPNYQGCDFCHRAENAAIKRFEPIAKWFKSQAELDADLKKFPRPRPLGAVNISKQKDPGSRGVASELDKYESMMVIWGAP